MVFWLLTDATYHLIFGPSDFDTVDPVLLVLDGAQLAAITWLVLKANRTWPLWAAAASLICYSGHLAILIHPVGMRRAYWAMTQLPQYIQLAALLIGTHALRLRRLGPHYPRWRKV